MLANNGKFRKPKRSSYERARDWSSPLEGPSPPPRKRSSASAPPKAASDEDGNNTRTRGAAAAAGGRTNKKKHGSNSTKSTQDSFSNHLDNDDNMIGNSSQDVDKEDSSHGPANQDYDDNHPSKNFMPGDVITITVGKANPKQDSGIKVERRENGKYYIHKVPPQGLFGRTPIIPGDKILEVNDIDIHDFKNLNALKRTLRDEKQISIMVARRDPDASDSSAS